MDFLVGGIILIASVVILAGIRWVRTTCLDSATGRPEDARDPFVVADLDAEDEMFSPKR